VMIFVQNVGKEIHIIDCLEDTGESIDYYINKLRNSNYFIEKVFLPHDAQHKRLESNKSIEEQFQEGGFRTHITEMIPVGVGEINGIQQLRKLFPRLWFDKENTKNLVKALEFYHKEWDEKTKSFREHPKHDWSSDYADAMRYLAFLPLGYNLQGGFGRDGE